MFWRQAFCRHFLPCMYAHLFLFFYYSIAFYSSPLVHLWHITSPLLCDEIWAWLLLYFLPKFPHAVGLLLEPSKFTYIPFCCHVFFGTACVVATCYSPPSFSHVCVDCVVNIVHLDWPCLYSMYSLLTPAYAYMHVPCVHSILCVVTCSDNDMNLCLPFVVLLLVPGPNVTGCWRRSRNCLFPFSRHCGCACTAPPFSSIWSRDITTLCGPCLLSPFFFLLLAFYPYVSPAIAFDKLHLKNICSLLLLQTVLPKEAAFLFLWWLGTRGHSLPFSFCEHYGRHVALWACRHPCMCKCRHFTRVTPCLPAKHSVIPLPTFTFYAPTLITYVNFVHS